MENIPAQIDEQQWMEVTVLEPVFRFLQVSDLVNCRAVCKQWKTVGTVFLVEQIDEIEIKFQNSKSIVSFMDMSKNCAFQFSNFSFYEIPMSDETTEKFLKEFGSSMTKLKLHYSEWSTNINSKQLSDILTKTATSLTELIILSLPESVNKNPIFSSAEESSELKIEKIDLRYLNLRESNIFVRDLFHSCKFLKSLSAHGNAINALAMLLENGSIQNFQDLEINSANSRIASLLVKLKTAPMKRFAMKEALFLNPQLFNDCLQFINDHRETWKYLELSFSSESRNTFSFPVCNNLKDLSIDFQNIDIELDYQRKFPNLVTLKFVNGFPTPAYFDTVFPVGGAPVLSLKNLELPSFMTAKLLLRIKETFPNVVNLKMNTVERFVLPALWFTWPMLESLNLIILNERMNTYSLERDLDSIFSGIENKNLLLAYMSRLGRSDLVLSLKTFPSIDNLIKLRRLVINQQPRNGDSRISDVGAILSFVGLKELQFFQVADTIHKITPNGLKILCDELQLGHLTKNDQLILTKHEWDQEFDVNKNDYISPDEDEVDSSDEYYSADEEFCVEEYDST